jgi:hypothetical protein
MLARIKTLWHDPVWSKVIAAMIIGLAATVGSYFLNLWPAIGAVLVGGLRFLLESTAVSNWVLLLLILLSLPLVVLIAIGIWHWLFATDKKQSSRNNWRLYTVDKFFGLRWRWKYLDDGTPYQLSTFCPDCDYQVYPEDVSTYRAVDRIGFNCESCRRLLGQFDESAPSLENKVARYIQQKVRTGKWGAG